jgi:hypothetical protein
MESKLNELLSDKSEITRKNYIQKIMILKNKFFPNIDKLDFLKNDKDIIDNVNKSTYGTATKKAFFIALYVIADKLNLENKKKYYDEMISKKNENNEERKENTIKVNKMNDYESMKKLRSILKDMPETSFEDIRNKLLISLYVLKPPLRNDFENVLIVNKKPVDSNFNYIVKDKDVFKFYLNKYKTVSKYGTKIITYSKQDDPIIYDLLKKLKAFNTKYLISDKFYNPLNDKEISSLVIKIFKKYLNKHITINMIRQIYESELIQSEKYKNMSLKEKEVEHEKLGHSFYTANQDYNKINLKNNDEKENSTNIYKMLGQITFHKLTKPVLRKIIKAYNLHVMIKMSHIVDGKRVPRNKKEIVSDMEKHLFIDEQGKIKRHEKTTFDISIPKDEIKEHKEQVKTTAKILKTAEKMSEKQPENKEIKEIMKKNKDTLKVLEESAPKKTKKVKKEVESESDEDKDKPKSKKEMIEELKDFSTKDLTDEEIKELIKLRNKKVKYEDLKAVAIKFIPKNPKQEKNVMYQLSSILEVKIIDDKPIVGYKGKSLEKMTMEDLKKKK